MVKESSIDKLIKISIINDMKENSIGMTVGQILAEMLRRIGKAKGRTVESMAAAIHVSRPTMTGYLKDGQMRIDDYVALAQSLGEDPATALADAVRIKTEETTALADGGESE